MLFRTYIAHRPPQLSNTGPFYLSVIEKPTTTVWYKSIPLGKNSIANIMKKMKLDSPLSIRCPRKRITNHSARKQVVKKLKSAGIPKCEIKNITGHSTEKGLDDYGSNYRIPRQKSSSSPSCYATGATARKEFIYDVILLEYLATGCYRCYSSQGV